MEQQTMSAGLAATVPTIPAPRPGFVLVECVWPLDRGEKNDCRGGTGVVWAGQGDVKEYPAALWPKLQPHPDVWRLYDPERAARDLEAAQKAEQERQTAAATAAAAEAARIQADEAARQAAALENQAAAARAAGMAQGTDVVTAIASASSAPVGGELGDGSGVADQTLAANAQASTADAAAAAAAAAGGAETQTKTEPENFPGMVPLQYTAEQLAGISDDDIRLVAAGRNYNLHPRLNPENLRLKFLEAQAAQKAAAEAAAAGG